MTLSSKRSMSFPLSGGTWMTGYHLEMFMLTKGLPTLNSRSLLIPQDQASLEEGTSSTIW